MKQIAYKTQTATPIATPTAAQANVSVTYLDGLGRTVQQIACKMANNGNDIVQPIVYDAYGRQTKSYLPYAAANSNMDFTDYTTIPNINMLVGASYPQFSGQNFYSETLFDNSPLNRVMKQAAVGTDWEMGSGHEVKYDYKANTLAGDHVRQFSSVAGVLTEGSNYADNTLYKTVVYDENTSPSTANSGIEEFRNIKGQVVLKRTYAIDNGNSVVTAHDTYNVYDELDNLAFVLPPKAVDATSLLLMVDLYYNYKYDYRNRLIEKKEPGKQLQFIVYDELNRIVATGPATNPFGGLDSDTGWMRTYYDNLNRVCYTGWVLQTNITTASRATLQNSFNGATIANVIKTATNSIDGKTVNYNNLTTTTGFKLLTVNYYDNYSFPDAPTVFTSSLAGQTVYYNNTDRLPKGLPTGSWTRALTTTSFAGETAYILYDYRARPIETKTINYLGGFTSTQTKLDFSGKIEYNLTSHSISTTTATITTKDAYTYSDQDRMLVHTNQVNQLDPIVANRGVIEVLTNNSYNNIGQLLNKKVGGTTTAPLQTVDYTYNIRGWLKGINDVNTLTPPSGGGGQDLFAYQLNYNDSATGKLYNGNISETLWRTNNDNVQRKYSYQYDQMNRLVNAVYIKPQTPVTNTNNYGEAISYDQNGNITHINRNGNYDVNGFALQIDNLTYTYAANSNQVLTVADATNSTLGFKDNTVAATVDYAYDLNGNQKLDNNKGITSIKYNHLNLPTEIIFNNNPNTKITYLYNAAGDKLQKLVQTTATAKRQTDYLGGYQYLKATVAGAQRLQFFPTAEGYLSVTYVNATTNSYNYVYNYTDQLGNVRLSYGKDPTTKVLTILEENNYYPYGLKHTNYNGDVNAYSATWIKIVTPVVATNITVNAYKYNGKEYQDELALNLYDMDMRDYDPATARWTGIDPVTHFSQSPYSSFDGNPVLYSDPSGADSRYDKMWAANTSYLNSSLGSSSNWGQSAVSGNGPSYLDYIQGASIASGYGNDPISFFGNTISINWNAFGNGTYNWNASTGVVKQWHEGSFDASPDFKGNDFVNQLGNVNLGYWVQTTSDKVGLVGIYGGTYLDMLSDYAEINSKIKYTTAFDGLDAVAYTAREASYYSKLSTFAGGASKIIGTAGVALSALSIGYKLYNNINVSTAEYVSAGIGTAFLIAGSIASAAAAGTALAAAAPVIGAIAIGYGFGEVISYTTTGKTLEENFFK